MKPTYMLEISVPTSPFSDSVSKFDEKSCHVSIQMLLFTICALFTGVVEAGYDIHYHVAEIWGGISKDSLKTICDCALSKFVESRVATVPDDYRLQALLTAARNDTLKEHLEDSYNEEKNKIRYILYGSNPKASEPKAWNPEVQIFLLALKALLPPQAAKNRLIANAFGVNEQNIKAKIKASLK